MKTEELKSPEGSALFWKRCLLSLKCAKRNFITQKHILVSHLFTSHPCDPKPIQCVEFLPPALKGGGEGGTACHGWQIHQWGLECCVWWGAGCTGLVPPGKRAAGFHVQAPTCLCPATGKPVTNRRTLLLTPAKPPASSLRQEGTGRLFSPSHLPPSASHFNTRPSLILINDQEQMGLSTLPRHVVNSTTGCAHQKLLAFACTLSSAAHLSPL